MLRVISGLLLTFLLRIPICCGTPLALPELWAKADLSERRCLLLTVLDAKNVGAYLTVGQFIEVVARRRVRVCSEVLTARSIYDVNVCTITSQRLHEVGMLPRLYIDYCVVFHPRRPSLTRITKRRNVTIRVFQ